MTVETMPKVELHVHLDGSVRPSTLGELLHLKEEEVLKQTVAEAQCKNLNDYLAKFDLPIQVMQTKENLERIALEFSKDLERDHVIYAEVRFAPLKHMKQGLSKEEVVEAVLRGLKGGNVLINVILCCMRDDSFTNNCKVIDLANQYPEVVAVDLAGAEAIYPTHTFGNLFAYAKEKNVPFTIHAGEADGYESIQSALSFGAKRIGHGVLALPYADLLREIKEKDVLLEVCPTSNIQTNIYQDYSSHPIYSLYQRGVSVSINTDNRTVSAVTLSKEYQSLMKSFPFTIEDFYRMNIEAIEHSFLKNEEKEKLLKKYRQYFS